MSDSNAQEPTMEEILASIRRIISEDDAPAADAAPEAAPAAAAPAAPAFEAEPEDDDVLELTETVAAPPPPAAAAPAAAPYTPQVFADTAASSQVMGDLDISFPPGPAAPAPRAAAPPSPAFEPQPASAYAPDYGAAVDLDEPLLSDSSADRAASYFGALGLSRHVPMPAEGRTLEHLVAELLRPVLKDWLDQHLPSIVEAKVQAEVERVSRRS